MAVSIQKNMVVESPIWPEPVRVLNVEAFGTMYQIDAVGIRSRQFYQGTILTDVQIDSVQVLSVPSSMDFSGDAEAFHLALEAQRIRLAWEEDPHFAVNASAITPLPHQLEAVYRYMLKSPLVRFLLADDPGAGKTIMAGLLLKELRFRGLADRVLIVVPPLVARQWQEELEQKFKETFTVIDNGVFRANEGRNPWLENDRCITSLYWSARDNVLGALKEAEWDLVIVDEAHKMAAYRQGQRSQKTRKTRLYRLGEELSVRTHHFLLLTATPHKGDPENFRLLLELLDKDLFADRTLLEEAMRNEQNPILLRRLKEDMRRFDGSPLFPPRSVKTVGFNLSRSERALYDEVTQYVTDHFNKALQKEKRNVGFAMTILQRRMTSSLTAIRASLERRHAKLAELLSKVKALVASRAGKTLRQEMDLPALDDVLSGMDIDDLEELAEPDRWRVEEDLVERLTNAESVEELEAEVRVLDHLVHRARGAELTGTEAKYNQLLDAVLRDEGLAQRGEKLLIFTESKDTLDFLTARLKEQGFSVATLDGSMSMDRRRAQVELFRGSAQMMVATEAGGESINLQFCNQMVNYDIPWNPNRLEQRMGRIHRIGQHNEVFIFNLVATDTREGAVLSTLLNKMEEMRKALGSDRVFDLVGEMLEDAEVSLADLLIDCITNRRRLEEAMAVVEQAVSPEHQQALVAAREEGLARQLLNLPQLRVDAARSTGRALLPQHLEGFFTATLTRHRGRWQRRADGALRLDRVPVDLRREQEPEFRRRYGRIEKGYSALAFEKKRLDDDGRVELLGPGHPLFESVLMAAEVEFSGALPRGTVFFDVDAEQPERIWLFKGMVADGTGRALAQRLLAVRELQGQRYLPTSPLRLFNLRPASQKDIRPPPLADFEALRRGTIQFCLERILPGMVTAVAAGRIRDLSVKERYLERSFRAVISRHSDRLLDMEARATGGEDMAIAMAREQGLMEDAQRRQKQRLDQVRREQQILPRAPEFLGVAAVLPSPGRSTGKARSTAQMLDAVSQLEVLQGRSLQDVRHQEWGYDGLSASQDGKDVRFLFVREPDDDGRIWLTALEALQLATLGRSALCYVRSTGDDWRALDGSDLKLSEDAASRRAWTRVV